MVTYRNTLLIGLFLLFLSQFTEPSTVRAQVPTELGCGQSIESVFTENAQTEQYFIQAEQGWMLVIYAETRIGQYEDLEIDTGLWGPNRFEINRLEYGDRDTTRTIRTDPLSVTGRHEVYVRGWTDTGGTYQLSVTCIDQAGNVTSGSKIAQGAACGSVIENNFGRNSEYHLYFIYLNRNDRIKIVASTLAGAYEDIEIDTGFWAPNGFEINRLEYGDRDASRTIDTAELPTGGIYRLYVQGWTSTSGNYELAITCTLADGTTVLPGSIPSPSPTTLGPLPPMPTASFSGFGFAGLDPVDFSAVLRLPIPVGVPMSAVITPNGNEILGYQFDAEQGDVVELVFARLSGNLNLGLVVLTSSSEIAFQSSLVSTTTLTTQFVVPISGEYTIGVFRIALLPPTNPEPTAFQLQATVNP